MFESYSPTGEGENNDIFPRGGERQKTPLLVLGGTDTSSLPVGTEVRKTDPSGEEAEDCTCPSLSGVRTEVSPSGDEGKQRFE